MIHHPYRTRTRPTTTTSTDALPRWIVAGDHTLEELEQGLAPQDDALVPSEATIRNDIDDPRRRRRRRQGQEQGQGQGEGHNSSSSSSSSSQQSRTRLRLQRLAAKRTALDLSDWGVERDLVRVALPGLSFFNRKDHFWVEVRVELGGCVVNEEGTLRRYHRS